MTEAELVARLLAEFPRDPSINDASNLKLPRQLIALPDDMRERAARAFLLTSNGKEWVRHVQSEGEQERRYR